MSLPVVLALLILAFFAVAVLGLRHRHCRDGDVICLGSGTYYVPATREVWQESNSEPGLQRSAGGRRPPDTLVLTLNPTCFPP